MQYWLVKQEPADYSWTDFVKDGRTAWTGVRNFQARNNLRAMTRRDMVLFYHSGGDKAVIGVARVTKPAFPDPTATEGDWVCVELAPVQALARAVTLLELKADAKLREMALVKQSRLSVCPVTPAQFERVLKLSGTKLA